MISRKKTRKLKIKELTLGGDAPIVVQSMCNTDTRDVAATVAQIKELEALGCEFVRVAVPDVIAARAIGEIKRKINIPLVADIHFDYRLALECVKQGIDKLRINPGNIGSEEKIKAVVGAAKGRKIPIRIGVNSGSLEKDILKKYDDKVTAQGMVESAMRHINILENLDFRDIVISLKASDVQRTVEAYRLLSQKVDYPLHLGITEAGTIFSGTVKSSIGLGALLLSGIGDTIRVSLTADPCEEVRVAKEILKSLELRNFGRTIISCPTCGRTEIDLIRLAREVERKTEHIKKPIKIAVMGCVVNGPGEAREADVGVAGGKGCGVIFRHGKIIRTVKENKIIKSLLEEIDKL
ncbi:MAG: flavodoxin-dependent (E)-4-hydroxy-3-methylbut-2-enyl-diphosphate synthase [Patescibacteria group bacterium]